MQYLKNPVISIVEQQNKLKYGKLQLQYISTTNILIVYYKQIPILSMDIEQFIQEPNQFSFDYDDSNAQQVPLELYDHDSQQEPSGYQNSIDQVISLMMNKQCLIDKPINQIISQAVTSYHLNSDKVGQFAKKVKKTKNILKRNRAKNRLCLNQKSVTTQKKQFLCDQSSTQKDTIMLEKQIKKQRNRISAQISRDRKKNYVANLEQKNKELALQSQSLKLENQKLRKQISEKFVQESQKNKVKTHNNKFVRLLVLLGIVFFVYLLKDIFTFKTNKSSSNMFKVQKQQAEDAQIPATTIMSQNSDIIEEIKSEISQMNLIEPVKCQNGQQKQTATGWKDAIIKKIAQINKKTKQLLIPRKLALKIIEAKGMLIF